MATVTPKKSAAVILLRESPEGLQVFLLKRSERETFMAGTYVFPGGLVDDADSSPALLPFCDHMDKTETNANMATSRITAMRELFEEAGVLLARDRSGRMLRTDNVSAMERFHAYRDHLHKNRVSLSALAQNEGLVYAIDELVHFAHWITPEARPVRFDTHFFVAPMPEGQTACADGEETVDGRWITPVDALAENLKGTIPLMPPTIAALEDLSRCASIDSVVSSLKDKDTSRDILPVYVDVPAEPFVVFPWDPEFTRFKDGGIPRHINHGEPAPPGSRSTRVVFRKGMSIPYYKDET